MWSKYPACHPNHLPHHDQSHIFHEVQSYDNHMSVLMIGSFPIEHDIGGQEGSVPLLWRECAIAWTSVDSSKARNGSGWESMDHFSTLPYGWIPKDGVNFFSLFIQHLRCNWLMFCTSAEERLVQRVRQWATDRCTLY